MRVLSLAGWKRKNWELCRDIVKFRDDDKCALCGSDYNLQVDHCFTRGTKELFYVIENLTLLCSRCHFAKSKTKKCHADLKVYRHVLLREGEEKFNEMAAAIMNKVSVLPENTFAQIGELLGIKPVVSVENKQ